MIKAVNFIKLIRSFLITLVLVILFFNTSNGKLILIPFIICSIALLLKDLFIIFNKEKYLKIFDKLYIIGFFIFWFGFLIYFDYLCFIDKNYQLLIFSIPFWLVGIFFIKKKL